MKTGSICLVGLPGAGKSTVGRHLARRLQCNFLDSDAEIELRTGCKISRYFALEGEPAFRAIEAQVISELVGRSGVLSTGGGAVLSESNRDMIRAGGRVVYLHATPEELYRRLRHDTQRPLLQVANPLKKLQQLYSQRDQLYREVAHFVVETGRPSVAALVDMVLKHFEISSIE